MSLTWFKRLIHRLRKTRKPRNNASAGSVPGRVPSLVDVAIDTVPAEEYNFFVQNGFDPVVEQRDLELWGRYPGPTAPYTGPAAQSINAQAHLEQSRERLVNAGMRVEAPRVLRTPRRLRQPTREETWEDCALVTMGTAIKALEMVNEIVARVTEENISVPNEMEEKLAVLTLSCCKVLETIGNGVAVDE